MITEDLGPNIYQQPPHGKPEQAVPTQNTSISTPNGQISQTQNQTIQSQSKRAQFVIMFQKGQSGQILQTYADNGIGHLTDSLNPPSDSAFTNKNNNSSRLDMDDTPTLNRVSSVDDKRLGRKVRKRKALIVEPDQYLPGLLVELSDYHYKHTIRSEWKYQAVIPEQYGHQQKAHKLVCLRRASEEFSEEAFTGFKKTFGEERNEQQLCMIKLQLGCSWKDISRYLQSNKETYRKYFKDKDRPMLSRANSKE